LTDRSVKKKKKKKKKKKIMPRSEEQFDIIRKQKKELIINVALELFAENGFHATSMSLIANKAGISKGLAYNYFESKQDILDEIIQSGFDAIYSNLDISRDGILTDDEFMFFIRENFNLFRSNQHFWRLYYSLVLQPKIADSLKMLYLESAQPILKMLNNFIVSKDSKSPEADLIAISAMLEGAYLLAVTTPELFNDGKMEEQIITACFKILNN
jgi:AcrR family transcriptional regulator